MGYRSEVAFVLDPQVTLEMTAEMIADEEFSFFILNVLDSAIKDECLYGHGDWIKWYDTYKTVKTFENVLNDTEGEYLFFRIGENIDDIEERGSFYENPIELELVRTVEFKFKT